MGAGPRPRRQRGGAELRRTGPNRGGVDAERVGAIGGGRAWGDGGAKPMRPRTKEGGASQGRGPDEMGGACQRKAGSIEGAGPPALGPPRHDAYKIGAAAMAGPRAAHTPPPNARALSSFAPAPPRPARGPVAPGSPVVSTTPGVRARVLTCGGARQAGPYAGGGPGSAGGAYCPGSAPSTWRSPSSSAAALWVCASGRRRDRQGGGAGAFTINEACALIGRPAAAGRRQGPPPAFRSAGCTRRRAGAGLGSRRGNRKIWALSCPRAPAHSADRL